MENEYGTGKRWAGGICIKDNQVLLIYRVNKERDFNQEYFLFPGREAEADESLENTIVEEFEEMTLRIRVGDLFFYAEDSDNDETTYYYPCDHLLGEPRYVGKSDEMEAMREGRQLFTPVWVPIQELDTLIVYPEELKEKIMKELQNR